MNGDRYRLKLSTSSRRRAVGAKAEQKKVTVEIIDPYTGEITTT